MRARRAWRAAIAAAALAAWAAAAAAGPTDEDCLACHSGGALDDAKLDVDAKMLGASVHAGMSCTDCHADLAGADLPHGTTGPAACGSCHEEEARAVERSAHRQDDPDSPRCWSCHGGHDVRRASAEDSRTAPLRQDRTCLGCHANPEIAGRHALPVRESAEDFEQSVHYRALLGGNPAAPSCTTCHGAHDNVSHKDPDSPIARPNVASTCGMCHAEIAQEFTESMHGKVLAEGNPDVPTCTGCHAEHAIRGPKDPRSPVHPSHIATTCSHCHENERLAREYGIASARLRTFVGSYHGAASRFGDSTVANCASCHGSHGIRPSSDPKSSIHPSNLARTCGTCHPQAGLNFATGKIHVRDLPEDNYWAWLVRRAYVSLIWAVIGGFVALIAVDLWWRFRTRRSRRGEA